MSEIDRKPSDFINARALAEHLNLDYGSLRNLLNDKDAKLPPCVIIGKRRMWRISVVEKWLEENLESPYRA